MMFHVRPSEVTMFDQPLDIIVYRLKPGQNVTLTMFVRHDGNAFQSTAQYTADNNGQVDLTNMPSLGGSYQGVHPMGLFWSLRQSPGQRSGLRLLPRDVSLPVTYSLSVFDGHMHNLDSVPICDVPHRSLSRTELHRHFVHPDVSREEVAVGRVHGGLFVPRRRPGPLPAVIDLFGTAGGLVQHRAALLASHGFVVFALAYFGYKDTPAIDNITLEYFQEAINVLRSRPEVKGEDGVGVVGVSMGGVISLLSGIYLDGVKSVVWINGDNVLDDFFNVKWKGKPFPVPGFGDLDVLTKLYADSDTNGGVLWYRKYRETCPTPAELEFPIERAPPDRQFLLLASCDDQNVTAVPSAKSLLRRARAAGRTNVRVEEFEGAGHLLEPPYVPHAKATFHKVISRHMNWGGEPYGHAASQERMWPMLRSFLAETLGQPPAVMRPFTGFDNKHKL